MLYLLSGYRCNEAWLCKLDSKTGIQDVETNHNKIHHIHKVPRNRTHLQNKSEKENIHYAAYL